MSISSQYEEEKQKAQERSVAIKILDMMKPLRNSNSKNKARRWVWELLQNAKDVCIDKVKIKIDFNEKEGILKFYHTGKPFDVQSITFLIEQVSTKQRDSAKAETTGKFGTGFLTTHLLSEIVNVDSVIYDESNNLRRFSITLDRSGRSIEEIIASIEKSAKQLAMADNNEIIANYNSDEFNTCFTYRLNSSGIEVAKQGLEDLKICLPYVMIFLNKVDSIYLTHNDTLYSIDNKYDYDCIEYYEFLTQTREEVNKSTYISIKNNNVQIALPININSNSLIKIDEKCPRIFCDFPLIGTENFLFPAIVQSRFFNPTEPRDSIYLSQSDESEVVQNVDLMQQALSLFGNMCDFLSEKKIDKLCYLFDINRKYVDENVDAYWLDTELIDKLNDKLLHADLIKLTNGSFTAIVDIWDNAQVYFPHNTKKEIRKGLWELYYSINPESLPQIQDVEDWYKFSFNDFPKLNFERMFSFLGQNEAADDLVETLNAESIKDVISWLNCFLDIAFKDGDAWRSIKENEYAVLLNQKKQLAYWAKLKEDRIENGILKDIVEECGYDIKEELMSRDIILQDSELNGEVSDDDLVEIIDETLSDNQFSDKLLVAKKVISLYNDDNKAKLQSLSGFYEKLFGKIGERTRVNLNGNKLWHEAEKILIEEIVHEITSAGLVELLKDNYEFSSYEETILWIDKLIYFLEENYDTVARKTIAILPNQNGEFCTKDDILLDDGEIDEELKDIAKLVGEDVRELLLDKRVYLQMSEKSTMTEQYVCDKIRTKVEECVQTCNRVDMPWDAFDKLIVWFNNNGSKAKKNVWCSL